MKSPKEGSLPVSQGSLAAYLGISPTLLSMTKTGKHGNRTLSRALETKMSNLALTFARTKLEGTPHFRFGELRQRTSHDAMQLAEKLSQSARYFESGAEVLLTRLKEMIIKEREYKEWLHTLDQLVAALPSTDAPEGETKWLSYQQVITLERLKKNDLLAQAKLEIQLETAKIKARVLGKLVKELAMDEPVTLEDGGCA